MTTILLARHGETDWNGAGRIQGQADLPLNERGRRQASELAERLAGTPLVALYSSDLRRASETASIVAERKGMTVTALSALREIDVGEWSGLTRAEVEERFPGGFLRWKATDAHGWNDGESYAEMTAHVVEALLEIAAVHPDGRVLGVTHGGPIRAASAYARGVDYVAFRRTHPAPLVNCELVLLAVEGSAIRPID